MGDHPERSVRPRLRATAQTARIGLRLQFDLRAFDSVRRLAGRTPPLVLFCLRPRTFAVPTVAPAAVVAIGHHRPAPFPALAVEVSEGAAEVSRLLRSLQHPVPTHCAVRFHREEKSAPARRPESNSAMC